MVCSTIVFHLEGSCIEEPLPPASFSSNCFIFAGEYEFNLTSAHGISSGRYVLSVHNKGAYTQSVRCKMKLRSYVQVSKK
jgi:hypothetical protein